MVGDKQDIQVHVFEHLSKLKDKFTRFFPEVDMTRDDLSFIRDPFAADIHTGPMDFQKQILELKSNLSVKDLYKQSTLEKFRSNMLTAYREVSSYAIT